MSKDITKISKISNKELIKRTQEVEAEKARKKKERLERAAAKEKKKKQQQIEKLVAPILLILTAIVSFIVSFLNSN